ncbi:hypothetical protein NLU13_0850 [Sarocladium strictum]|uniref:Uncharacterized protein n=1 Tax=Sarocladium strictum TaxID=5046 RepID=A0AA39GQK9_SARSR|nr:hypothetical protein NLU13_0850 [Sarocladium strictum]
MPGDQSDIVCNQTAAEYGRHEGCFIDHQASPFTSQHILPRLLPLAISAESLLISGPDLRPARLPRPPIEMDDLHGTAATLEALSSGSDVPPTLPLLWYPFSAYQSLRLPISELDLGSDPFEDAKSYEEDLMLWNNVDISETWLPLAQTQPESDEGLWFPAICERTRLLLIRELERETVIHVPGGHDMMEDMFDGHGTMCPDPDINGPKLDRASCVGMFPNRPQPHCFRSQRISPPLSPVSECGTPFIPEQDVCVVGLTPDPASPLMNLDIRDKLKARDEIQAFRGQAEPILDNNLPDARQPPDVSTASIKLRLESPLLSGGSVKAVEGRIPTKYTAPEQSVLHMGTSGTAALCGGMLAAALEKGAINAKHALDDEDLNASGSVLRLPVADIDSDIPAPKWTAHLSSCESQNTFLHQILENTFRSPAISGPELVGTALKWNPIPKDMNQVRRQDSPTFVDADAEDHLLVQMPLKEHRQRHASPPNLPLCFQIPSAEEHDLSFDDCSEITSEKVEPYLKSCYFTGLREPVDSLDEPDRIKRLPSIRGSDLMGSETVVQTKSADDEPLDLLYSLALKRKDRPQYGLNHAQDFSYCGSTGDLLGSFLALRGHKRPRIQSDQTVSRLVDMRSEPPTAMPQQKPGLTESVSAYLCPEFILPKEKACYVVSLKLGRVVLKHLDARWPSGLLIDRDPDRHTTAMCASVSTQFADFLPSICQDADVALTPQLGVVVTTMLKAAQRPLPGTQGQTPLRKRIETVSRKYENTLILVSEDNPAGELSSAFRPSDAAAYADLVRFITTLSNDCISVYVPGSSETLAKWIISLMCKHSAQALAYKHLLNPMETSWEVFLRRAGMNMMAAQVLASRLSRYGNSGLSQFLSKTTQEKLTEFGDLVGKKALVRVSQVLDRRWS